MKIFLNILFITIASINLSLAEKLKVFDFTETELSQKRLRDKTYKESLKKTK